MPTFKLDDREIPFEPGDSVIRAAHRVGIDIPHYCWHPGLTVAANCRMCLVEVMPPPGRPALMLDVLEWDADRGEYVPQRKPKLQPSCQLAATDGMVIKSQTSEHAAKARSAVQELLLLNHPVDCPICDQAGECRLQDYWLEHQTKKKRMRDEPVHKPKAVRFGPTIVYDAERCIVCTRCVRVSDELAGDSVLSVRERGNLNEIVVAPGRELDHNYTLMTEHVCPVGALTSIDFRFKARVWFLRSSRSVCVGCSTGCNSFTDFDPRNQKVYRYRPRENLQVNKYWMCDVGMLDYRRIHERRVLTARLDGQAVKAPTAVARAVELLGSVEPASVSVVLSAEHSQEDNTALLWFARQVLGATRVYVSGKPPGAGDDVLLSPDRNPNGAGLAQLLELTEANSFGEFTSAAEAGKLKLVLALGSSVPTAQQSLPGMGPLIALATHEGPWAAQAEVVLPASSWAESDGHFVNKQGLTQRSEQAIAAQGESRPAWRWIAELAKAMGRAPAWKRSEDARRALSATADARVPAASAPSLGVNG